MFGFTTPVTLLNTIWDTQAFEADALYLILLDNNILIIYFT